MRLEYSAVYSDLDSEPVITLNLFCQRTFSSVEPVSNPNYRTVKALLRMVEACRTIVAERSKCAWSSVVAFVGDAVTNHVYWRKHGFARCSSSDPVEACMHVG